jgi:chromosome segregation ATPase
MSDMSFSQAADEVRKILRGFRAVEQVSAALERAGSIENAVKEGEARLAAVRTQIEENVAALDAETIAIERARTEAKTIRADAKSKAEQKIEDANARAAQIIAEASQKREEAEARVAAAEDRLSGLALDEKAKIQELAALDTRIAEARAQIAALLKV